MSRVASRVGPGVQPTTTTVGVPGTSDDVRAFIQNAEPKYARPCFVTNTHASDLLYVLPNEEGCAPDNYLCVLQPGQAVDISVEGQINIQTLSLYYDTADYASALVRGWYA